MEKRFSWRLGALASAIALLGSLASPQALALGLGRISVQSALGEPLRAEIDIAEINADEAASLRASIASADAFRAAGLEYSASVSDVQVTVQKRADGRSYLRLSGVRTVTEPFVDLILEANWASGRVVRDYTMLFDPPNLRQSGSAGISSSVTAPVLPRPTVPAAPPAAGLANTPYASTSSPPATKTPPVKTAASALKKVSTEGQQLAVKPGDTAGKIAAQVKPASISLDQMLAALLRNNPNAFIGGNINRLKSGSVLDIPGVDEAGAISAVEASTTITAQSKDFNDFRRKLAENVPATQTDSANRQAGGKVQAKVEDKAPVTVTPDKLTLSKGSVQGKSAAEDKIAKERQAKQASDRANELSKNIGDLSKLSGVPPTASTAAVAASAAKATGIAVTNPGVIPNVPSTPPSVVKAASSALPPSASTSTAKPVASAPIDTASAPLTAASKTLAATTLPTANVTSTIAAVLPASAAMVAAPVPVASQAVTAPVVPVVPIPVLPAASAAPVATPTKPVVVAKTVQAPEPSLVDELTGNPFVLPGFAGLLLLLGGFGFYRYRQRHNSTQVDSAFLESRLQPDSFFGASGGQRIDTNEGGATGSSLVYSPSQLDAAGDVDPVAEADVYLAYGRDLQAEEILKEALRTSPNRVAVHAKLMEIYAKRRDVKAFEVIALDAFNLTHGEGPEWDYIAEMGRGLDASNTLYQPDGQPAVAAEEVPAPAHTSATAFGVDTLPVEPHLLHEAAAEPVDFDLDLDFSLGDDPVVTTASQPTQPTEPTLAFDAMPVVPADGLDIDFGTDTVALMPTLTRPSASAPPTFEFDEKAADDALSASGLTFTNEPFTPTKPSSTPTATLDHGGMLEFDMSSLSLELDDTTTHSPVHAAVSEETAEDGPLETKFALAEEFRALGDMDGARSLAEEVLMQATGSLKTKAQAFVNALS